MKTLVGTNLRRVRIRRGLSLERLAKVSGVSRAMLSQIELGHSTPTITILWKVARALEIPLNSFLVESHTRTVTVLKRADSKTLVSADNTTRSRALFPEGVGSTRFYELRLRERGVERADAQLSGTTENLVVSRGRLIVRIAGKSYLLDAGDALHFQADVPHEYENPSAEEAVVHLVLTDPEVGTP